MYFYNPQYNPLALLEDTGSREEPVKIKHDYINKVSYSADEFRRQAASNKFINKQIEYAHNKSFALKETVSIVMLRAVYAAHADVSGGFISYVSQQKLADICGASKKLVNMAIKFLRKARLIFIKHRNIQTKDGNRRTTNQTILVACLQVMEFAAGLVKNKDEKIANKKNKLPKPNTPEVIADSYLYADSNNSNDESMKDVKKQSMDEWFLDYDNAGLVKNKDEKIANKKNKLPKPNTPEVIADSSLYNSVKSQTMDEWFNDYDNAGLVNKLGYKSK